MKSRCGGSCTSCPSGLTLVEVLAGLAILGTLLAGVLLASARLIRNTAAARQSVEACRLADALLGAWWADPAGLPVDAAGEVEGLSGWTWRTQEVPCEQAAALGGRVVAVEIFAPGQRAGQASPAAQVAVLAPRESDGQATTTTRPDAR